MAAAPEKTCDVLVIGGGPAGSTISTLLARDGIDVVTLEKDRHPRFHIGESLLPSNMPLLDKLGVRREIEAVGMPKYGATFSSPWHDKTVEYLFGQALDKSLPLAYQVRRSVFDEILFKMAASEGARTFEGARAGAVEFRPEGGARVTVSGDEGETVWQARYLVDASGRDTLLSSHFGIKRSNLRHNSAAVYGHFTGAKRLEGKAEGHISVYWFEHGWFWFIPLADGTTSIGAVCRPDYINARKTDVTTFFKDTIALSPGLSERLAQATLTGPATATGNYSYCSDRMSGPSYLLIGDAFAFVDPVFSTGVYLAMLSGLWGADVVKAALKDPAKGAVMARQMETKIRDGTDVFSWFIHRMTQPAFRDLFMGPRNVLRVQEAMLSLLAGDIFDNEAVLMRLNIFKGLYYIKTLIDKMRGPAMAPAKTAA
jgi:flavin-dependent dehydrogenase